tara:strand:+ start:14 stop:1138 length:1125 start_codon:yes stop_codon:yes gene_type:complete
MSVYRILILGLLTATQATLAWAEPYIAFREGYKCSACHVNQTGGGMRNEFGGLYTQTDMTPLMEGATEKAMDFSPQIGSNFTIGADFMAVHEVLLEVDEELDGQRYEQDSSNYFGIRSGSLYFEANLIPEMLSIYLDETVTSDYAKSREAFVLIQGLPYQGYLKAGRMLLPYGVRVWDDATFSRRVTGFTFDSQKMGVEFGFEPGNLFLAAALSNNTQVGAESDNEKQIFSSVGQIFSSVGALYMGSVVLGASFANNEEHTAYGPYAGVTIGSLTAFCEVDWVQDSGAIDQDQFIAFGSVNYWHREYLNLRVAFDFLDPYDHIEEDESSRLTLGAQAFLTPYLQAGVAYKLKDSFPQNPQGNADALTLALHSFF